MFSKRINDLDRTGRVALDYATSYNHFEALEMLLNHKASMNTESAPVDKVSQPLGGKTQQTWRFKHENQTLRGMCWLEGRKRSEHGRTGLKLCFSCL